jgi:poly-gamma-glutamate synthesis protein (capsule biosynthesis protein)
MESFFEKQKSFRCKLPEGFKTETLITLSATGDLMDHPFLPNSIDHFYVEVSDLIFGADISMSNLECVVFSEGSKPFKINLNEAPPLYYKTENFNAVKGFRNHRYTFMTVANNHSLDCGEEGVASTISALKKEGILFAGMNESEQDANSACVIEKNGIKVGLISSTFGLNAKKPPPDKPWIVNRNHWNGKVSEVDFAQTKRQIEFCRKNGVDLVIAQLHWGLEHEFYPRPDQLDVAHSLAELGVDVVIGHHPHVIQPMEYYQTKRDPDRIVPIYYSLGNLVTPFGHPDFRKSAVARLEVVKGISKVGKTSAYVKGARQLEVFQEVEENVRKLRLRRNEV